MTTSNRDNVTNIPEGAYVGEAMLKKRRKMTPQQAYSSGKLGKADLHIHSTYSDGIGTIEQILAHVQHQTDLDVIAITDHDAIEGSLRARDLWAQGEYRFEFVVGEEVSTREGHLLGLFIEEHVPPSLSMERSIDLIHEQGGLAVIEHPLDPLFRHSCQRNLMDRIHANADVWFVGIEAWIASCWGGDHIGLA